MRNILFVNFTHTHSEMNLMNIQQIYTTQVVIFNWDFQYQYIQKIWWANFFLLFDLFKNSQYNRKIEKKNGFKKRYNSQSSNIFCLSCTSSEKKPLPMKNCYENMHLNHTSVYLLPSKWNKFQTSCILRNEVTSRSLKLLVWNQWPLKRDLE